MSTQQAPPQPPPAEPIDLNDLGGYAETEEELTPRQIRISGKHIVLAFVALTGCLVIGAIAWHYFRYRYQGKRVEGIIIAAGKALAEAGGAVTALAEAGVIPRFAGGAEHLAAKGLYTEPLPFTPYTGPSAQA